MTYVLPASSLYHVLFFSFKSQVVKDLKDTPFTLLLSRDISDVFQARLSGSITLKASQLLSLVQLKGEASLSLTASSSLCLSVQDTKYILQGFFCLYDFSISFSLIS